MLYRLKNYNDIVDIYFEKGLVNSYLLIIKSQDFASFRINKKTINKKYYISSINQRGQ